MGTTIDLSYYFLIVVAENYKHSETANLCQDSRCRKNPTTGHIPVVKIPLNIPGC